MKYVYPGETCLSYKQCIHMKPPSSFYNTHFAPTWISLSLKACIQLFQECFSFHAKVHVCDMYIQPLGFFVESYFL